MEKGYIHVYTGNGKGKTTSVMGLMLRAAGFGLKIYFGQFMKSGDYSEIKIIKERFPEITLEQYGGGLILQRAPSEKDKEIAKEGLLKARAAASSGDYDLVVLDEINVVSFLGLIDKNDVLSLMDSKAPNTELVLSGRYADKDIIEKADLVSEIKEIKHYMQQGVMARKGIEM